MLGTFLSSILALGGSLGTTFASQDNGLSEISKPGSTSRIATAKKVLAFYYPWYGSMSLSGSWIHWERVDSSRGDISASTNYPKLGPYDSLDPKVIGQHCEWAAYARIDALIVSWWGRGDRTDRAMPLILDAASRQGLKVTIYHERIPEPASPESAARDIFYVLKSYGGHRAWLKEQGKPVVFVYGRSVGQIGLDGWAKASQRLKELHSGGALLIGDSLSGVAARVFDGIHTYNTAAPLKGRPANEVSETVRRIFGQAIRSADAGGKISTTTVIPGYDDTKIRNPGLKTERFEGLSYLEQWEQATLLNPDWVLITSFNEWHEGSEIEPSVERGDRYLFLTRVLAGRFKRLPPKAKSTLPRGRSAAIDAPLRRALSEVTIGLLPQAQSATAFWLRDAAPKVRQVGWADLAEGVDPKEVPILVFAGGESYTQAVRVPGDVDRGLELYLSSGGALVVAGNEPLPFYYNEREEAVNTLAKLGLPLSAGGSKPPHGWETVPLGEGFGFRPNKRLLPGLTETLPLPESPDLRWRPFDKSSARPGIRLTPLLSLHDGKGAYWGEGAAVLRRSGGGEIAYIWFNLLEEPYAEQLLSAVFREVLK